jgi:hypothetical protein
VSLGAGARSAADPFSNGGRHLPPRAFHDMLERAAAEGAGGGGCQTVLIDARNAYETQIGRCARLRLCVGKRMCWRLRTTSAVRLLRTLTAHLS